MQVHPSWKDFFDSEQVALTAINDKLKTLRQNKTIYPSSKEVFNAFKLTAVPKIKAVIIGQDPYHGENQAHGLSFSVKKGMPIPPSLMNIYKELANNYNHFTLPTHGNLEEWSEQGVLLLNRTLTVEKNKAASHDKLGWKTFTLNVVRYLCTLNQPIVFLLWGKQACDLIDTIKPSNHVLVLQSSHPSPLSAYRGFVGCNHFKIANEFLISQSKTPINWQLSTE